METFGGTTDRQTDSSIAICPLFFKKGGIITLGQRSWVEATDPRSGASQVRKPGSKILKPDQQASTFFRPASALSKGTNRKCKQTTS